MVTMKTIAAAVNVSQATVSYVLNGRQLDKGSRVNPETVLKVEAAALKLGYHRNEIARSVRTGKSNVFGIIGFSDDSYSMKIIHGIATTCEKNSYLLKLLQLEDDSSSEAIAQKCIEQRLSGVICSALTEKQLDVLHQKLQKFAIPIVLVDNSFSHNWCSRVISDDVAGGRMAVEYLLKLGHRRIANISGSLDMGFSFMRNQGYCQGLAAAGIEHADRLTCISQHYNFTDEFSVKIKNLLQQEQPTALFCNSDPIALKTLKVLFESGLRVPQDISVIGYAGLNYTDLSIPALTTIKQPFANMGRNATEILIDKVTRDGPIREVKLPVELIVRESTAPINGLHKYKTSANMSIKNNEVEYVH
jgi:DNA-binding LacI/PurR family transcriptional regulator